VSQSAEKRDGRPAPRGPQWTGYRERAHDPLGALHCRVTGAWGSVGRRPRRGAETPACKLSRCLRHPKKRLGGTSLSALAQLQASAEVSLDGRGARGGDASFGRRAAPPRACSKGAVIHHGSVTPNEECVSQSRTAISAAGSTELAPGGYGSRQTTVTITAPVYVWP